MSLVGFNEVDLCVESGCDRTLQGLGKNFTKKEWESDWGYHLIRSKYAVASGGFSGQLTVHGLPSCRLLKTIPVFSLDGEKSYGFNEETKPMLNTSHGFIPWGDSHHPDISQTKGELDGRWVFINENNKKTTEMKIKCKHI